MDDRSVSGNVRTLLRLEAAALLAAALLLYAQSHAGWSLFLVLFLAPDLSFAFYLFGARAGAIAYNAAHSTIGPFLLALAAQTPLARMAEFPLWPVALIWFAHIGFDRALGFGLKYASGFHDTHLGVRRHRSA
jgi:hypothetical protein